MLRREGRVNKHKICRLYWCLRWPYFSRFLHRKFSNARRLSLRINFTAFLEKNAWLAPLFSFPCYMAYTSSQKKIGQVMANNGLVTLLLGWRPFWEILDPSTIPYCYTYIYVIPAFVEFTQHKLPHIPVWEAGSVYAWDQPLPFTFTCADREQDFVLLEAQHHCAGISNDHSAIQCMQFWSHTIQSNAIQPSAMQYCNSPIKECRIIVQKYDTLWSYRNAQLSIE